MRYNLNYKIKFEFVIIYLNQKIFITKSKLENYKTFLNLN